MVYQMVESTHQSKQYIEDNFTICEIKEWFQFSMYTDYCDRKQRET